MTGSIDQLGSMCTMLDRYQYHAAMSPEIRAKIAKNRLTHFMVFIPRALKSSPR